MNKSSYILAIVGLSTLATASILGAQADTAIVAITGVSGLTLTSGNVDFGFVTLNGTAQDVTAEDYLQSTDNTGTGNGWNVQLSATQFFNSDGNQAHALAPNALSINGFVASTNDPSGTQSNALFTSNGFGPNYFPLQVNDNSPVKIVEADAGTGQGTFDEDVFTQLHVPANSYTGNYSSTWTLTINVGP